MPWFLFSLGMLYLVLTYLLEKLAFSWCPQVLNADEINWDERKVVKDLPVLPSSVDLPELALPPPMKPASPDPPTRVCHLVPRKPRCCRRHPKKE
jgi:hypothetical protein